MFNMNGPPGGSNVVSDQSSYDLVYQDIIIKSNNRNNSLIDIDIPIYSDPWKYTIFLTKSLERIYKAELLNATIPFDSSMGVPVNVSKSCIFISIDQLNGNTIKMPANGYSGAVSNQSFELLFSQIQDNSFISGSNVVSTFGTPNTFQSVQFYNPPLNKITKFDISLYGSDGNLLSDSGLLDHYFTIRVHYFQRRNNTSSFSIPINQF